MYRAFHRHRHRADDHETWRAGDDGAGAEIRACPGVAAASVCRGTDGPREVTVTLDLPTLEAARALVDDAEMHRLMSHIGVSAHAEPWNTEIAN